jgi:iron(III) transport system permease protein
LVSKYNCESFLLLAQSSPMALTSSTSERFWRTISYLLAGLVLAPLIVIISSWSQINANTWSHLSSTLLPTLISNTTLLILGVGIGVSVLGVSLAWLTSLCDFPGRHWLEWGLMLPFALPTYVLAFVFLGLFDFSGPVQSGLRSLLDLPASWSIEARHPFGVLLVMSLVLYPYVYLLARSAFLAQGRSTYEAARSLGLGTWASFWQVSLPMARPSMIAGLSLALMEALADFGAVSIFNFDTFTTAIYKAWFGFFDIQSAAQLASLLLLLVLSALFLEQHSRSRARFVQPVNVTQRRLPLSGLASRLATLYTWGIFCLAFMLPVGQLAWWAWESRQALDFGYLSLLFHTLSFGLLAALLTVAGAFILAFTRRHQNQLGVRIGVRIGTLGYALPGSVLAVGVMLTLTWLDQRIADVVLWITGSDPALFLTGTLAALLFAYFARFLAVAYGPVETALSRLHPHLQEAAHSLGASSTTVLCRLYLPILQPGLFVAMLLVLVDVMKEMPATLLLRPFGWDTLAVQIHGLTAEGEWTQAALPALALVLAGLLPVLCLEWFARGTSNSAQTTR